MSASHKPMTRQMKIALAATLRAALKQIEDEEKDAFAAEFPATSAIAVPSAQTDAHDRPILLGKVQVNQGRATYDVEPGEAMAYVIDRYGPGAVEEIHQIREQYINSLLKEAKEAHEAGQPLPPGVSVTVAEPFTAYYPNRNIDALEAVREMVRAGAVDLGTLLPGAEILELE